MSAVLALQVADAITTEINGHTWNNKPEAFTAARKYFARYQDGDLKTVAVTVIPLTQQDDTVTRAALQQTTVGVWIDVQRKCNDFTSVSEVDGYLNFLAEIKDYFNDAHRLPGLPAWWYQDAVLFQSELWSPQRLYLDHVFEGAVELTVRADR